jgi:hypothetical protein
MKNIITLFTALVLMTIQYPAFAAPEERQDRREERGRSDERQGKRDCRQEEGVVGQDKRECKQEEVRDGVRGNKSDSSDDETTDK